MMSQGLKRLKTKYETDGKKAISQNYDQTTWNYKKFPTFLKERGDSSQLIMKPIPSKLHFKNSFTGNLSYRASLFKDLEDMLKTKKFSAKYSLFKRGWGTIELQKSGINKNKALDFYLKKYQIKKKNVLFFGNEFEEDGNDLSIVENNFNVIGLSNEKSKLPVRQNLFYGGHRGVASTGFHLSYLLEIYEAEVKKIKHQKSNLHVEPLVKTYIKILRENLLR
jgi:hydroxymethylpyrimidine pyrophosphatase-like HAD family hydrolase